MPKLLDILLQRNDTSVPWGFRVRGGLDRGSWPVISSVTFGTLAAQYLNAGDKILEIEKQCGNSLRQSEIEHLVERDEEKLQLLVEKLVPNFDRIINRVVPIVPSSKREFYEVECVKQQDGNKQKTEIWMRETNRTPSLGEYDLEVNFVRTKYGNKNDLWNDETSKKEEIARNQKRLKAMSKNFEKIFREKIGEWLEHKMPATNEVSRKQQTNSTSPAGNGTQIVHPPPPPSFPGSLPGRRLKTEIPERCLEPPSVIQNAMMTKDKKPFTYTPGGIDLSEIRSPKMQRRINRNACADEMPVIPTPTTNQQDAAPPPGNTHFAATQSQLPAQVLPVGAAPFPPPPPPPPPSSGADVKAPSTGSFAAASAPPKPTGGRPPLGFDPNELLARVNKTPAYEPAESLRQNFKPQPVEEKPKLDEAPADNKPGHIYVPQVTPRTDDESPVNCAPVAPTGKQLGRGQLGSLYVPPVASVSQEQSTPSPTSPIGHKPSQQQTNISPPAIETKPQAPWVTVYRTPQSSVPWTNREPESPKSASGTRIIPIQVEGRDSPKSTTASPQPQMTPPPFLQKQKQQQQQKIYSPPSQLQVRQQQQQQKQQQSSNTRVIPIQIEGSSVPITPHQPWSGSQNKFNPMSMSPTPYSPSQEKDQKPQWAPVQPRPFKKEPEGNAGQQRGHTNELVKTQQSQQSQQPQSEYGTYNTAGVPLSQLRKMQLSDDDKALMDKFKSQVERQGNDSDENSNPRYRGGYIPSRVFRMLDESVDEENYLHREPDPRYRGAVIPSRAFRMLQSMTDTVGDMPQQVPRSPSRGPSSRPLSGTQFQQEAAQGPYVPPSEQQIQEPRKYTGGSIPSRSFRMLQAMTGQEVSAPPSGSTSGRETPVSGINRWCPSPSPSPVDPFWGCYPPDPYFLYNYIFDLNAAYGFLPLGYAQPPPFYYHRYQNSSDGEEQGYSSTDELAQYYINYRKNFGYSPLQPDRKCSTPNPFPPKLQPRVCVTPLSGPKIEPKINRTVKQNEVHNRESETEKTSDEESSTEESETDTEVEDEAKESWESNPDKLTNLQSLKSVPNVSIYSSESSSTVVQEDEEQKKVEDADAISSEEEEEETEHEEEKVPHQLSVIFEESEHSDAESTKRTEHNRDCGSMISESESCSTLDHEMDDDSDNELLDAESSVIVRLPLKLKFSRTEDEQEVTTVIVGDSEVQKDTLYSLNKNENKKEMEEEEEEEDEEDSEANISVTFTVPTRSNSVISVEKSKEITEEPEVEAVVTVCLSRGKSEQKEEVQSVQDFPQTEKCDRSLVEEDSSSSSLQSGDTVLKHKEDTDNDSEVDEEKSKTVKLWIEEENSKDCEKTDETDPREVSYEEGVGRLEEMISTLLETTRDTMSSSVELSDTARDPTSSSMMELSEITRGAMSNSMELPRKKDFLEESEEDDSGVTSDISIKQVNSETDADTESDYSELSKMTKFQRASTHSRLFKLLQEECERSENEECRKNEDESKTKTTDEADSLAFRKQKLTLPLNQSVHSEVESLSSSSGIASPSSPTISDRLVKELIHSLLTKKKGKKFRKLPLAKLHAAALKILQEDMESYDTSPASTSGDDGTFLSPIRKNKIHSKLTAMAEPEPQYLEPVPESIYGENYYDYLDYYNTWGNPELYYAEDYDIVPSRAFRMLSSPMSVEGFKARCPRVASKKKIADPEAGRKTPSAAPPVQPSDYVNLSFAEKQQKVSKVLKKSAKI